MRIFIFKLAFLIRNWWASGRKGELIQNRCIIYFCCLSQSSIKIECRCVLMIIWKELISSLILDRIHQMTILSYSPGEESISARVRSIFYHTTIVKIWFYFLWIRLNFGVFWFIWCCRWFYILILKWWRNYRRIQSSCPPIVSSLVAR